MKYHKEHYKKIICNNFKWSGFWDNMHHFVKKENNKYRPLICSEEDLINGNFKFMANKHLTRV